MSGAEMNCWGTIAACRTAGAYRLLLLVVALFAASVPLLAQPSCTPLPAGIVSWWRAEGSATDSIGSILATPVGGVSYTPAVVGQGFYLSGNGSYLSLTNSIGLQAQNFTIEAWIRRTSATLATESGNPGGLIFGYGPGGYTFGIYNDGRLTLSKVGVSEVTTTALVANTSFHHLAVTKNAATVVFYVDGVAYPAAAYDPGFTFSTTPAIGATLGFSPGQYNFYGIIDELAFYNRGLAAAEIQTIYAAGNAGKCVAATLPSVTLQPANQAVPLGTPAVIAVTAAGSPPLSYQWNFNGSSLPAATNSAFLLPHVSLDELGLYSVLVTNAQGSILSSNAVLSLVQSNCGSAPLGIDGWWQGEGSTVDSIGTNNGIITGNTAYGPAMVGQGFVFSGAGSYVQLANATNLQTQTFTIEAWVRRASTSLATAGGATGGNMFGYGSGGYNFGMYNDGSLSLTAAGVSDIHTSPLVTDTNLHHLAVTKTGSTVVFYMDGAAYPVGAYDPGFSFSTTPVIGALGTTLGYSFWGSMDEVSFYSRALSASEIQGIYDAAAFGKCLAPYIGVQPASQTDSVTATANFAVSAGGSQPLYYQWWFNGSNLLAGATSSILTLPNLQLSQAGSYRVVVSNAVGSTTSSNAILTVIPFAAPAISSQPTNQTVVAGTTVSFGVSATGNPPPAYQWQFDGTPLPGATNSVLRIPHVSPDQLGAYRVLVTNSVDSVLSSNAVLSFIQSNCTPVVPGLVSWWPAETNNTDIVSGNNGTNIGNVTYGPGISGQGFVMNGNASYVRLANNTNLQTQTFTIEAWVKRASASVTTAVAAPGGSIFGYGGGGWNFGIYNDGRLTLTKVAYSNVQTPALVTDTNFHHLAVTKSGSNVVFFVDGVAYSVGAYDPGFMFVSTPAIGTLGAGSSASFWGEIDELGFYTRALSASEVQAIYAVGSYGKCPILAPYITAQPANRTNTESTTVSFSVTAIGAPPLFYQWLFNDTAPLSGATNSLLVLTNVQLSQAGSYSAVVSNALGSTVSSDAMLAVNPAVPPTLTLQPTNQAVPQGGLAYFAASAISDPPPAYQWRFNGSPLAGATNSNLVLVSVSPGQLGTYDVLVTNYAGSLLSSNAVLSLLQSNCSPASSGLVSWWQAQGNAVDTISTNNGTLIGTVSYGPGMVGQGFVLNGNGAYIQLANSTNLQTQTFTIEAWIKRASASLATGSGALGGNIFGYGSGGYNFGLYNNGRLSLTKAGTSDVQTAPLVADTNFHHLAVTKTGSTVVFYVDGTAYPAGAYDPGFTFSTIPVIGALGTSLGGSFWGTLDEVSFYNRALSVGEVQSIYAAGIFGKCPPSAPYFTMQPTNRTDYVGGTVIFATAVLGAPPLHYQWWFNGTNLIPGATSNVLVLNTVQLSQAGSYSSVVTNSLGSAISSNAVLTLNPAFAPTITSQPVNAKVFAGGTSYFSVMATGGPSPAYQWQFNSAPLAAATSPTLVISNVSPGQAGTYAVLVTNYAGSVLSSNAVLSVVTNCTPPPPGLVGWWQGEGNAVDLADGNNGTLVGSVGYGAGMVGQGFVMGGSGSLIQLANATNLQTQTFTIETWVKRASASVATGAGSAGGNIFGYGTGGYNIGIYNDGRLSLTKVGQDEVTSTALVMDTNFHHLAVTKTGTNVVFYVDGVSHPVAPYDPGFTFSTSPVIGAAPAMVPLGNSFLGTIDEVSFYNRALAPDEVQSIYDAGSYGKCSTIPPIILVQPTNQTVVAGSSTSFQIAAAGSPPLAYSWMRNGAPLASQTNPSLLLTNIQASQAGTYSALVSNLSGSMLSSNAVLIVVVPTNCVPPAPGMLSWWRAEGDAIDLAGANDGTPVGSVNYGPGMVGQGFVMTGNGSSVQLANSPGLQVQDFTIEAWIKRASASAATAGSQSGGNIFGYGTGGYNLGMYNDGSLSLTKMGESQVNTTALVTDTNFHHVAVTKTGTNVVFYVDGMAHPVTPYDPGFNFGTTPAIGAGGAGAGSLGASFWGSIDEIAFYTRGLLSSEIQAIYDAGSYGKCSDLPPIIVAQPTNQTVFAGGSAVFGVVAGGSRPLKYVWSFNGAPLSFQTNTFLLLTNTRTAQAGSYSVLVTNSFGASFSSNAVLTVLAPTNCTPDPSGLVSWWACESNALDLAGGNNGMLMGNVSYGPGMVGQAFVMGGNGSYVQLSNAPALQVQSFTIEAWLQRASSSVTTGSGNVGGEIFAYGPGGYAFAIYNDGRLSLSKVGTSEVATTSLVTDTSFHHLAVTKSGTVVVFYMDGAAYPAPSYDPGFTFSTTPAIGATLGFSAGQYNFWGIIDEIAFYNRALSAGEIQTIFDAGSYGKCSLTIPPVLLAQPRSQTAPFGSSVTLSVNATGPLPLSYQWNFNGSSIAGATNTSLVLTNVQQAQTGSYSVTVSNLYGSVQSSNAFVRVLHPVLYDPAAAFSTTANPAGVWSYGFSTTLGSPMALYREELQVGGADTWRTNISQGDPAVFHNANGSALNISTIVLQPGALGFHPGPNGENSVIRFTAPAAGQYELLTAFSGIDTQGTSTDVHVLTNTVSVFDGVVKGYGQGSGATNFSILSFNAGDFLDFSVGNGSDASFYYDGTGLSVQIGLNHPPAASNVTLTTRQDQSVSFPVSKLLMSCSDPDSDPLVLSSVSASSTNAGAVVSTFNTITYTPPASFVGADRFTYTVGDNHGGFASAYVLVTVTPANQQSANMLPPVVISGGYQVNFLGLPGYTYSLQRASSISGPWSNLATVTTDSNGLGTYADTNAPSGNAFYRTTYP
ncbi:MAG: hypothetical protein C5B50_23760 [Verrucomicrobia bacterium]|nr:MAG: hypothetical protein C5B50_23760 [Verrucomicrobiota bacterium]